MLIGGQHPPDRSTYVRTLWYPNEQKKSSAPISRVLSPSLHWCSTIYLHWRSPSNSSILPSIATSGLL